MQIEKGNNWCFKEFFYGASGNVCLSYFLLSVARDREVDNHTTNYGLNAPMTRLLRVFEQSRSLLSFESSLKRIISNT